MEPLATVLELADRANEDITEPEDVKLALSLLRRMSSKARHYGRSGWTRFTAPEVVRYNVIEAAWRGYENPAGYAVERGDMLTLTRSDDAAKGGEFTTLEIAEIRQAARRGGIWSANALRPDVMSDDDTRSSSGGGGGGGTALQVG